MLKNIDLSREVSKEDYKQLKDVADLKLAALQRQAKVLGVPVIVAFDGRPVSSIDELHRCLVAKVIGIPSLVTVVRHTEKLDLIVTPGELMRDNQRN